MRPKIICHMVTSIDGRLHPSRFTARTSGIDAPVLRRHSDDAADSFKADGWMVDRTTMQEIAKGAARAVAATSSFSCETNSADRRDRNLAVAIDPHGKVHYGKDNTLGDHVVAVLARMCRTPTLLSCVKMGLPISSPALTGGTCPRRCKRYMRPSALKPCSWRGRGYEWVVSETAPH